MVNNDDINQPPSLLQFPCDFVIKIFGISSDEFELQALTIIRRHISDLREDAVKSRQSKDGKYLALTITMPIDTREQLDAIYQELSANPLILMVL